MLPRVGNIRVTAARALGLTLAAAALTVPILILALVRPEMMAVAWAQIGQPADDGRVPVMVEMDMAAISGDWPAAAAVAGVAPFRPSGLIPRLQDALPSLRSFRKIGRALPLLRVDTSGPRRRVLASTFFACGTALKADIAAIQALTKHAVFQNPPLSIGQPAAARASGGSRSVRDVVAAIDTSKLPSRGEGVLAAIVGPGFNQAFATRASTSTCGAPGAWPCFDARFSHSVIPTLVGGTIGSGSTHSAMVAYDITIAAPDVTWADEVTAQNVCDAAEIYVDLAIDIIEQGLFSSGGTSRSTYRGLLVVNSWAVPDPTVDLNAAAYVDNPNHPTSVMVGTLADLGADVVFAAGNCGPNPKSGCVPNATRTIYGANSHPKVLTVGAVGLDQKPADYSSRGTGRLALQKPDIGAYSDFVGSTKFGATDSGTSAAAPVAAGVLATLRSSVPFDPLNPSTFPAVLRERLVMAAEPCAPNRTGYPNYDVGWGVVSARCF
jgi:hypothetical protein